MELIEGKLFQPTLISWVPSLPFVGIFPYVQTLLPQLIIVLAAVAALVILSRQKNTSVQAAAQEIKDLT
jgi:high-affinity iron transporter